MQEKRGIIIAGGIVGIISVLLVHFGNPANMGFCIACFLRDIAGGIGIHRAPVVQYIRPEIIGLVLGAFFIALKNKEFKTTGGSSPFTRFVLGASVMIGALMFLGCPLRMMLRIAGGDLNALLGLAGFVAGIYVGILFLNKGFSLKRSYSMPKAEGYLFPAVNVGLLVALVVGATFLFFSEEGPGSMHAPIWISLLAGLIVGALAQRTRLCMAGGIRDLIMFKDSYLISGFLAIILFALIGNLPWVLKLGFAGQTHCPYRWAVELPRNGLGRLGSVLRGCPSPIDPIRRRKYGFCRKRHGNGSRCRLAHNFGLASSGEGPTANGQIAVIICLILVAVISIANAELFGAKEGKKVSAKS